MGFYRGYDYYDEEEFVKQFGCLKPNKHFYRSFFKDEIALLNCYIEGGLESKNASILRDNSFIMTFHGEEANYVLRFFKNNDINEYPVRRFFGERVALTNRKISLFFYEDNRLQKWNGAIDIVSGPVIINSDDLTVEMKFALHLYDCCNCRQPGLDGAGGVFCRVCGADQWQCLFEGPERGIALSILENWNNKLYSNHKVMFSTSFALINNYKYGSLRHAIEHGEINNKKNAKLKADSAVLFYDAKHNLLDEMSIYDLVEYMIGNKSPDDFLPRIKDSDGRMHVCDFIDMLKSEVTNALNARDVLYFKAAKRYCAQCVQDANKKVPFGSESYM